MGNIVNVLDMSRTGSPIVTGVSPNEGPPGTKLVIRGENFGNSANELLSLTICDCDCTLLAEWKSPNKIVARCGATKGKGSIIVTTRRGGVGSCTVQFRCYSETIGPTKESAVWVESPMHTLTWQRGSLSPTSYQQEDPLGLSVEVTEKTIPVDDLNELFPGCCGDLGSEQFSAGWFLLENHHATSFDDLRAGLSFLRRKVENQKEGQLSFLKANVGSVLDQLDTLVKIREMLEVDRRTNPDFTSCLEKKIEETKDEGYKLFEDVLARRERADATRNALAVLQRFKFLFCLPSVIDRNVKKGDFDLIINDYARVKHLFGNTDVALFSKFLAEVESRIEDVRNTLLQKLKDVTASSVDEHVKIIRNLINLEAKGDVAWVGIESFANFLIQSMHDLKDKYIIMESSESAKKSKAGYKPVEGKPPRVQFVEELVDLIEIKLADLWKLGQTYFGGEFQVEVDPSNPGKFKSIVLSSIQTFSNLLRAAILAHSLNRNSQTRHTYGIWSNAGFDAVILWLPHCLRYFRACYSCFIRIDFPSDALDIFSKLIFDLRLYIVVTLFRQAADDITHLTKKELWLIEVKEKYGGITQLPILFDELARSVIQTVHETVLIGEVREVQLLDNAAARKDVATAILTLFTNFAGVLEIMGFVTDEDQGERSAVISQLIGTSDVAKPHLSCITWEQRLLAVMCNCDYTADVIIPELLDYIKTCGYPISAEIATNAKQAFVILNQKIQDQYLEIKCDPLVGTIEPSMYLHKFDWDMIVTPTDVRPYAKEIIMNLIGVRSELYRVPPIAVHRIMHKIIEIVAEETARLMSCVKGFSVAGSIQARADVMAIQSATCSYLTQKSRRFFTQALDSIPALDKTGEVIANQIFTNFKSRMELQLFCLNDSGK